MSHSVWDTTGALLKGQWVSGSKVQGLTQHHAAGGGGAGPKHAGHVTADQVTVLMSLSFPVNRANEPTLLVSLGCCEGLTRFEVRAY